MESSAVSQTRYVLITRLVMPVSAFLLLVLIGRQSDLLLGQYALVTTYFFIMQTLPLLGLAPYVMKEVARAPERAGEYYVTVGALTLIASLLINVLVYVLLAAMPYSQEIDIAVRVVGLSIFPGILAFLAELILISLNNARSMAYVATIENIVRLLVSAIVLQIDGDVVDLFWVLFATRTAAFLIYLAILNRQPTFSYARKPNLELLREVFKVLPAFLVASVLFLVISRLDYIVLSVFENIELIGYYAIAYRVYEIGLLAISAVITAVFLRMARQYTASRKIFIVKSRIIFQGFLLTLIPLSLIGYWLADSYVFLLFNNQYPHPVLLTQLFVVLLIIGGLDQLMSSLLLSMNLQQNDVIALAWGSAIYALALVILVPWISIYGAWVATIMALMAQLTMRIRVFHRLLGPIIDTGYALKTIWIGIAIFSIAAYWTQTGEVLTNSIIYGALILAYPLVVVMAGLFRPLRFLRFQFRSPCPENDGILGGLLAYLAADSRQSNKAFLPGDPQAIANFRAVGIYRLSRFFFLRGNQHLARLFWQFNVSWHKADIPPNWRIGPGLVLQSPSCIVISGVVGRNVTFGPYSGIGCGGKHDIGAGPGVPIVEDKVTFLARTVILGGIRVPSGTVLPAHRLARTQRQLEELLNAT